MVLGEGAAAIIIEELDHAQARGATIYGEIAAASSRAAAGPHLVARRKVALANVMRALLQESGCRPEDIDHLHAHGLSTRSCDAEEAQAIAEVFGRHAADAAGRGGQELLRQSRRRQRHGGIDRQSHGNAGRHALPARSTTRRPTPSVRSTSSATHSTPAGRRFINLNVTPQGQASGLLVQQLA